LIATAPAQAAVKGYRVCRPLSFINGDGSEETDLCIVAAVGAPDLNLRATRLGVRNFTTDEVLCNDMPLNEFMRHYRNVDEGENVITSVRKGAPRVPVVTAAAQP
jgi:hypothetical protein